MHSGLAVRIERCLGKGDPGSAPLVPDSSLPREQDTRRKLAELFARAKRSGCGKDGEPQQWDPSKASSSGNVVLDLAPPDKVASDLAPTDKESSSPSNLSVTGSVSSAGDTWRSRQCVVINAGGSPTKPNEGSHREPSFNSSSPAEPISSSSPTKLIHTMSPEELKGEAMLLSTMQAFDEVQTEENPLAPTGVAAMDTWLAALEADAAEGEALCRRLFDKDDYEMVTLPSEDKMDECNECNNELDNTECRVISQVEPEAKPEPEVCGARSLSASTRFRTRRGPSLAFVRDSIRRRGAKEATRAFL